MPDKPQNPSDEEPPSGVDEGVVKAAGEPAKPGVQPKAPDKATQMAERLRPQYQAQGLPPPDEVAFSIPALNLNMPADDQARLIGSIVRDSGLYLRGGDLVVIHPGTGESKPMTPEWFCTWIADFMLPFVKREPQPSDKPIKTTMGLTLAKIIIASEHLRAKLPVVERINPVKMPVFRRALDDEGRGKMELLQQGYDAETQTLTLVGGLDYPEDLNEEIAFKFMCAPLKYMPYADRETSALPRSRAAQVAAQFTVFCAQMLPRGARPPGFLWNANLEGSGKTQSLKLALVPVWGDVGPSKYNPDKDELDKELDSLAQIFAPYIFLDNVKGPKGKPAFLSSPTLEAWITATLWKCRKMGGNKMFSGALYALTMISGNRVEVSPDLMRRFVVVDLFMRQQAKHRELPADTVMLTNEWLLDEGNRSMMLASMWALLRAWNETGRPGPKGKLLDGFDAWSRIVAGVVQSMGFGDCLAEFDAPDSGDRVTRDAMILIKALITENITSKGKTTASLGMKDLVSAARRHMLFEDILGTTAEVLEALKKDKRHEWDLVPGRDDDGELKNSSPNDAEKEEQAARWTDGRINSGFAKLFRKRMLGLDIKGDDGFLYRFGDRTTTRGMNVELARVE